MLMTQAGTGWLVDWLIDWQLTHHRSQGRQKPRQDAPKQRPFAAHRTQTSLNIWKKTLIIQKNKTEKTGTDAIKKWWNSLIIEPNQYIIDPQIHAVALQ